ncbi:MAG: hypothetical protein ACPG8W_01050 [Candidatus Promineifilaceae bacterium]
MISTVTTAVSSVALTQWAQAFAVFTVLLSILLLIQKEIMREATQQNQLLFRVNRAIEILLIPLGIATASILAVAITAS